MTSGIYDTRGNLIESTIERKEDALVPASSNIDGTGNVTEFVAQSTFSNSNYSGNILIPDKLGNIAVFIGIEED